MQAAQVLRLVHIAREVEAVLVPLVGQLLLVTARRVVQEQHRLLQELQ
jgi:hypothetical protein